MRVSSRLRRIPVCLVALVVALLSSAGDRPAAQEPPRRWDGLLELISGRYDYPPPWPGTLMPANGASRLSRRAISSDGRYVVFVSEATNWGYPMPAIYRRDRRSGQTELLLGNAGQYAAISADGDHVTVDLCDPWMRPDNLPVCDAWALDLRVWTWSVLSTMPDGTFGDDASGETVLSRNGRFAVFVTKAANLTGGPAGTRQVVIRDRDADGNGILDEPGTAVLETISVGGFTGTEPGNADSETAEVSDDGRFVAFRSLASNLVTGDTNGSRDVFLRDRQTGQTRRLNVGPEGQQSAWPIDTPQISMSADGRYVAFASADGLLAPGSHDDTNDALDVFVHDRESPWLTRIDIGWGPPIAGGYIPGNGSTDWPTLSADGRYVSLESAATNVEVPPAAPGSRHAYVVDRTEQRATRVSVKPDGQDPDQDAVRPVLSGDGSVVLFSSQASNLAASTPPSVEQIYAAVHLEIAPAEAVVPGGGGSATFSVTTQQHTLWWAEWDWSQTWFGPGTGAPYGVGSGTMGFTATQANPNPARRSVTIRVAQAVATLTQDVGLSLTSIAPASGPMPGGTTVTLRGTGFQPGMSAWIGQMVPTQFVDSTTLTLVTPAHDRRELVPVSIGTTDSRYAWLDNAFTFTDSTPPLVMGWTSGYEGQVGWYTGGVTVNWGSWDPESEVISTTCTNLVVTADTTGTTYSCSATGEGGTGYGAVTVKRDATPPAIVVAVPSPLQLVELNAVVASDFSCTDATSGVADCGAGTLAGAPLDTSAPGWRTFSPGAFDLAGNGTAMSVEYAVSNGLCTPPAAGLRTWLRFDGNLEDVMSGNGTLNAGMPADTYVGGEAGQAYKFVSRGSQSLEHWHDGRLNFDSAMSVAMWLKPGAAKLGTLVRHKDQYRVERTAHGTINWMLMHPGTGPSFGTSYARAPLDAWSHVVFTYQAGEVKVYVNGRLDRTWNQSSATLQPTYWSRIRIGGPDEWGGSPYVGAFDELQFFDTALGAADVEQIFLSGASGICAPLPTVLEVPSPIDATFAAGTYPAVAVLRDIHGAPLPGKTIRLEQRASDLAGQPLASTTMVTDAMGAVRWDAPFDVVAGTYPGGFTAYFAGDLEHAHSAWSSATVIVRKAMPQITWATPAAITYGTALSDATQLNASANVPGSFSYKPGSGSVPAAGDQTLTAYFVPIDNRNYDYASAAVTIAVGKALPALALTGGTFTYDGQPHGAAAAASDYRGLPLTPVTITYDGSTDVPVAAGVYTAVASYAGDADHLAATASTTLRIDPVVPIVTVSGGPFTYDQQPHGATVTVTGVAGAIVTVPASVTYNNAGGLPVGAGSYAVSASVAASGNYLAASATGTLVVNKATPVVAVTGGTFTYDGQPHPAVATAAGVAGETLSPVNLTYSRNGSGPVGVPLAAGTYEVTATFQGSANYLANTALATVLIGQATPVLTWSAPVPIAYGTVLGASQLNAGANAPGTFSYAPAAGTRLNAGSGQGLTATFVPADPANYAAGAVSTAITVTPAPMTVRANDTVKRVGAPLPAFTATVAGLVYGELPASLGGTLAFATTATAASPVGVYPVVPSGLSSPNYAIAYVAGALGVVKGAVSVAVTASPEPSGFEMPMKFTATVAAAAPAVGSPAGTVRFFDGSTLLGTAPLVDGSATLTTAGLDPGVRTIEARYDGDPAFESGIGGSPHTVNAAASTPLLSIASSRNPSTAGQTVTWTATVTMPAGPVSGTVTFYDGATPIGSAPVSAGRAILSSSALSAGSHAITARLTGGSAPPSTSPVFVQAVGSSGWKNRTTSTSVVSSANPSVLGSAVVLTATVAGSWSAAPGGRILFMIDGEVVGDPLGVPVTAGSGGSAQAAMPVAGLAHGRHKVTATYLGDTAYKGSSGGLTQAVN